jgi:spermidine synthase
MSGQPSRVLALLIFFLSGFAALLYQVVWQRMLVLFSGADVYSITVVVAAFMGGLGTGSLLGGRAADWLGPHRSLLAFAGAELLVGVFGLASKPFYYDALYRRFSYLAATPAVAALVLFLTLLVPTFLMGLSLPLLARALVSNLASAPRTIGMLYGWNTLGAAAGALATPWMLVPGLGLHGSLWVAASLNVLCAGAAAILARTVPTGRLPASGATAVVADGADHARSGLPFRAWAAVYGLTGFLALGMEIAWFRLLGVLLKSTSFTFGTLLAVYLSGLGAGAAVGARLAPRSRRPGESFLALQHAGILYAAVAIAGLVTIIGAGHPIKLVRFLGSYDPVDIQLTLAQLVDRPWTGIGSLTPVADLAVLYLFIPAILVGPSTFLMGMSFAYLQKATMVEFPRLGHRLGILLAVNIAGGVLGTIVCAWWLLPTFGTAGTFRALVAGGAVLGIAYAWLRWPAPGWRALRAPAAVAAITTGAILAMPDARMLWARLHATPPTHVVFDEDGAGLSLLKLHGGSGGGAEVYVNGLGQSWIPYGNVHTALGALPAFVHPAPTDVALIGLGSGDTAFAAAGRTDIRRIVSIEILSAQQRTLERYARTPGYMPLSMLLADPRIEHLVGDGRSYLAHTRRLFDIIEADALRPTSAYAGNLYSREYFELVSRRLKPGGLAVTWAPTERIRSTFLDVYSHVLAFAGDIWIGSLTPIPFDADTVATRVAAASGYYATAGIDIGAALQAQLDQPPQQFRPTRRAVTAEINTDMFPRDEFALPFW